MVRLTRRVAKLLLRPRRSTILAFGLLAAWTLLGFVPALAPVSWLIWGSLGASIVAIAGLYALARVQRSIRELSRDIARLQRSRSIQRKRRAGAKKRMRRLEGALAKGAMRTADVSRDVARLEAAIERRQAATGEDAPVPRNR